MLLVVLGALGGVALSLALTRGLERIDQLRARGSGVKQDDVLRLIDSLIDEARSKGQNILSSLANRLNALSFPVGMSDVVQDKLREAKSDIAKQYEKTMTESNRLETRANSIKQRAATFASSSDSYKSGTSGQMDYNDIVKDASQLKGDYENMIKEVENHA